MGVSNVCKAFVHGNVHGNGLRLRARRMGMNNGACSFGSTYS